MFKYSKLIKKLSIVLGCLALASLIMFAKPTTARAYVDNMDNTKEPKRAADSFAQNECGPRDVSWGVGVSVEIKLFDENGNFQGYASNYTFSAQAVGTGIIRVGSRPEEGPATTGQAFYNAQFTMDGGNVSNCGKDGGGFERHPYVIDSEFYNDGTNGEHPLYGADQVMLDCLYAPGQTTNFLFKGVRINQPGWEGGEFVNPFNNNADRNGWLLSSAQDLNDGVFSIIFEFHRYPPGLKGNMLVSKHLLSSPTQLVDANSSVGQTSVTLNGNGIGPISQTGNQAFYNQIPATSQPYNITMSQPPDFKLVKYSYRGANGVVDMADINSNLLDGIYLPGNGTANVDLYYVPNPQNPTFYPWLQTKKGDVSSQGSITGQNLGVGDALVPPLGARHTDATNRYLSSSAGSSSESSFAITAGAGGKNFCSNNLYTLGTNQNADGKICNLATYVSRLIKVGDMRSAINNSWNSNGAGSGGSCAPYKTANVASYVNSDISLGCTNGAGIQKVSSDFNFISQNPPRTIINGRGTLWVTGKLTISDDIVYGYPASVSLQNLPNFVIFVDGNVEIDASVRQIDAVIIATGTINTCLQRDSSCNQSLVANGLWASFGETPINFARRSFNQGNPNASPAEILFLTGQTIIMPPPGLDEKDGDINNQLQINSGELPPRLK